MAEDSTSSAAVIAAVSVKTEVNKEEIENQENENNENALMEIEDGSNKMEVDQTGVTDETADAESTTQQNQQTESKSVQDVPVVAASIPSEPEENQVVETVKVKEESTVDAKDGKTSLASPAKIKSETAEVVPSANVQPKAEDGQDGDSYMVLEEADGDENDSNVSDEEELTENEQLRKANLELSERLALLEEFIEVEFSEKFGRFMKKRAHLVDVMGISERDPDVKCNGKRSSKSMELVGLLKLVRDQARTNGSPRKFNNRSEIGERNSTQKNNASSSTKERPPTTGGKDVTVKKDETSTDAKLKRCHRCRATGHFVRDCPLPIDTRDRRVILRKKRDSRKERDRLEDMQNPAMKAMRDRRRRITRALNRERQKMK